MKVARPALNVLICALTALPTAACDLYAGAPVEGRFERILNVSGPVELDVRTGSGGIRIDSGPGTTVRVVGRIRASGWFDDDAARRVKDVEDRPPIAQDRQTVRVGPTGNDNRDRQLSIGYEITVPEATIVRSSSGSGGQTIRHIGGSIHAATGSGGIRIDDTQADVHVTAGSGGIRITGVRGAVTARAGSGGIMVSLVDNGGFELDASAGSGGIAIPAQLTSTAGDSRHRVRGTVRGGGPRLDLSTGSGGIRVE
jgi:hypothetical protein